MIDQKHAIGTPVNRDVGVHQSPSFIVNLNARQYNVRIGVNISIF